MIFGSNRWKSNQEAFYLDKDPIEITHKYKYLEIHFYSHRYFELSSKMRRIIGVICLMGTLRKEIIVGVTCWELKSHMFKALVLPTLTYGTKIWGGDLQNSHWKVSKKGMKIHITSHVKVCSLSTYHVLLAEFGKLPIEL